MALNDRGTPTFAFPGKGKDQGSRCYTSFLVQSFPVAPQLISLSHCWLFDFFYLALPALFS